MLLLIFSMQTQAERIAENHFVLKMGAIYPDEKDFSIRDKELTFDRRSAGVGFEYSFAYMNGFSIGIDTYYSKTGYSVEDQRLTDDINIYNFNIFLKKLFLMETNIRPYFATGAGLKRYGIHGDVNASMRGTVLALYGGVEFRHSNKIGSQFQYRYAYNSVHDSSDNINAHENSIFYGVIFNADVF